MGQWKRFDRPEYGENLDRRPLHPALAAALDSLLDLGGSEKVLEVGTGTGRIAARLLPDLPAGGVVGIDPSPTLLRRALGKRHNTGSYRLIRGVAEALPVRGGFADIVLFVNVLHHLADPTVALREALRALASEGRLVILDPILRQAADDLDRELHRLIERVFHAFHHAEFRFRNLVELRRLVEGAGFAVATSREVALRFDHDSVEELSKHSDWEATYTALADAPELRERFEARYLTFGGSPPRVTGQIPYAALSARRATP